MRVLPPGDGSGGYLVVVDSKIHRLDRNGRIVQSYDVLNDPFYPGNNAEGYFALAIAPDGRTFWGATRQDVYHFDIATGQVLQSKIHATDGLVHTNAVVDGVCVMNEYRAARENCGVDGRGNGLDDDGDGVIDNGCFRIEICSINNPGDDDGNGLVDYNDPACYAPGTQPASTICAANGGATDPSVGGFCARQNAEGDAVSIAAIPPPCAGADCANWTISYSATGLPPGLVMNPQTGAVTGSPLYSIVPNLATAPPQIFNVSVTGSWTQTGQLPATILTTFAWTITNTNRPPVAVDDSVRAQSGQTATLAVLGNDSDPDAGDVLSIAPGSLTTPLTLGLVPTGTASIGPGGTSIQYLAPANFFGTVTLYYQARDNYATPGVSNQAKVTIVVNGSPVARNDSYQMQGGTTLTVNAANGIIQNLAGRDTDPEGSALTVFSNTAPAHGAVVVNSDGSFSYTPVPGYTGTDTFTYIVTDGEAKSNSATVSILVPNPPVAGNDTYATQQNTPLVVGLAWNGLLGNDSDPLGQPIRVSAFTNPAHGTLVMGPLNDGTFTYTPTTNYTGVDTFTYRVTNGNYESTNATVTINIVTGNNAPVAVNDRYLVAEGQTLTVAGGGIMANDSDPDRDLISAALVTGPSRAGTFSFTAGSGAFSYTPATGVLGDVTFTYKVSDPYGLASNVATVTIHVNSLPVANNDTYTVAEDTTLTVPAAGILANDTDVDAGSVLGVALPIITSPTHGTLTQLANGAFTYVPQANYNGTDTYTYRVVDENGGVSVNAATVTITITPVNDPPVAVADAFSVLQGNVLSVTNAAQGVIQRNDSDIDDAITVLRAVLVTPATRGSLQFNTDGTFTYTPNIGVSGVDSFTYFVRDAGNAVSSTVTVTITVIPTSITAVASAVCSSNAAYVDYALTSVNYSFPTDATAQIDWVDSTGRIVRTDAAQPLSGRALWPGTVLLLGLPVDWPGWLLSGVLWIEGIDGFELTKPAVTVRFTVGTKIREVAVTYPAAATGCSAAPPSNQTPVARSDAYSTGYRTPLTIGASGILSNDTDPEGGALTVALPLNTTPVRGTVVQNTDGSFVYTPNVGFTGTDSFSYRAKDPGGLQSNLATVTITVGPPQVVTVTASNASVTYGDAKPTITPSYSGFVFGDTAAVVTTLPVCTTTYTTTSAPGSTPATTCAGAGASNYTFRYIDGTVTINRKAATVTAGGGTKVFGAVDPALSATTSTGIVTGDLAGIALASTRAAGESVGTYVTTATAVGGNIANYTVTYNAGSFSITKATPVVTVVGGSFTYDGLAHGATCTVRGANDAVLTGVLSYSSAAAPVAVGTYTATCTFAGDANHLSATGTATIAIVDPNRAPVAVNDTYTATKSVALAITAPGVKVNDTDPDGDAITAVLVTSVAHGTLTLNADGSFVYTPTSGYTGVDTFTYKVRDTKGVFSNVATVTINITSVACNLSAKNDDFTTNKNHAISIIAPGLLKNDQDPYQRGMKIAEVNGQTAAVGATVSTAHGTVKVSLDGSFVYTPAANYTGTDSFTYKAKSNYNNTVSNLATVVVAINGHFEGDGCDHDRHRSSWNWWSSTQHNDGDGCAHDREMARHYAGDSCDHDRGAKGHHNGDGCGHDRDVHRHFAGDSDDHERGRNGHYNGDGCSHSVKVKAHYEGDGCAHDRNQSGHPDGDLCDHDKATMHHNEGDGCDHDRNINGHFDGDKCDHDGDDHGHNTGDGCDHDRGEGGHYDGDRCEHDDHASHDEDDDNPCFVTTSEEHEHHPGAGHDDQHHSGDYCDHDRGRKGHKAGDGCEHDKVTKHSSSDGCDHEKGKKGHYDGDRCDHDRARKGDRDRNWDRD